jgi:hypothetical protein
LNPNAPRPPTGTGGARGASYKKKVFYRAIISFFSIRREGMQVSDTTIQVFLRRKKANQNQPKAK